MATRRGASISIKMILATTFLLVVVVVGFGALNLWNVNRVYLENASETRALQHDAMVETGQATLKTLASSTRPFIQMNASPDLRKYMGTVVKGNDFATVLYLLDSDQKLIWHSDQTKSPTEGHADHSEPTWKKIWEQWEARKDDPKQQDALVAGLDYVGPEGELALFALPVFEDGVPPTVMAAIDPKAANRPLGYVVLGYTLEPLKKTLADIGFRKEDAFRDSSLKAAGVGLGFVLIGTLLAIFQGIRISRPIQHLASRAEQIAQGDLQTRVEISSTDEIGVLGENFNHMADQLVLLLRETAEKATLEKELEVARTIQDTLVPTNELTERPGIRFAGYFQPATQCGGDWWTYHDLADGRLLVVIGDVTGHGVPSAMITAAAKSACDVARAVHADQVPCGRLLEIMNRAIYESAKRKFVMTAFASIVDTKNHTITFANAGHNFPYVYRIKEGKGEFGSLMVRGNRLGDSLESTYEEKTVPISPGDVIVWYTDGVVECENEKGEEYGEKRFRSSIRRAGDLEPDALRDVIINSSLQFYGEMPRKDDITMVVGKILG